MISSAIPAFELHELEQALSKMKARKSPDKHGIVMEMIKYGSDNLKRQILSFFNEFLHHDFIEQSWLHTLFTMIPKTGDLSVVQNWRPIAILDIFYKVFSRLLYERLYPILNQAQCSDQHAYRKSYSVEDPLYVFECLTSRCNEYTLELWAASLDLSKAFDKIKHSFLFEALKDQGISSEYIVLLNK